MSKVRWSEQQVKALKESRAAKKRGQVKPPRKKKSQENPAPPRPTFQNKNSIIIGFDADVVKCGLAVYDVVNHKVLEITNLHILDIGPWLDRLKAEHGHRLYAKVEMADSRAIYGATTKTKSAREKFNRTLTSGLSKRDAQLFIVQLERREIRYEIIPASTRFNVKNNKLPKGMRMLKLRETYADLSPADLLQRAKLMKSPQMTKLNAEQIKAFFRLTKTGNSENRDALCLCMPEVLFFRSYQKK